MLNNSQSQVPFSPSQNQQMEFVNNRMYSQVPESQKSPPTWSPPVFHSQKPKSPILQQAHEKNQVNQQQKNLFSQSQPHPSPLKQTPRPLSRNYAQNNVINSQHVGNVINSQNVGNYSSTQFTSVSRQPRSEYRSLAQIQAEQIQLQKQQQGVGGQLDGSQQFQPLSVNGSSPFTAPGGPLKTGSLLAPGGLVASASQDREALLQSIKDGLQDRSHHQPQTPNFNQLSQPINDIQQELTKLSESVNQISQKLTIQNTSEIQNNNNSEQKLQSIVENIEGVKEVVANLSDTVEKQAVDYANQCEGFRNQLQQLHDWAELQQKQLEDLQQVKDAVLQMHGFVVEMSGNMGELKSVAESFKLFQSQLEVGIDKQGRRLTRLSMMVQADTIDTNRQYPKSTILPKINTISNTKKYFENQNQQQRGNYVNLSQLQIQKKSFSNITNSKDNVNFFRGRSSFSIVNNINNDLYQFMMKSPKQFEEQISISKKCSTVKQLRTIDENLAENCYNINECDNNDNVEKQNIHKINNFQNNNFIQMNQNITSNNNIQNYKDDINQKSLKEQIQGFQQQDRNKITNQQLIKNYRYNNDNIINQCSDLNLKDQNCINKFTNQVCNQVINGQQNNNNDYYFKENEAQICSKSITRNNEYSIQNSLSDVNNFSCQNKNNNNNNIYNNQNQNDSSKNFGKGFYHDEFLKHDKIIGVQKIEEQQQYQQLNPVFDNQINIQEQFAGNIQKKNNFDYNNGCQNQFVGVLDNIIQQQKYGNFIRNQNQFQKQHYLEEMQKQEFCINVCNANENQLKNTVKNSDEQQNQIKNKDKTVGKQFLQGDQKQDLYQQSDQSNTKNDNNNQHQVFRSNKILENKQFQCFNNSQKQQNQILQDSVPKSNNVVENFVNEIPQKNLEKEILVHPKQQKQVKKMRNENITVQNSRRKLVFADKQPKHIIQNTNSNIQDTQVQKYQQQFNSCSNKVDEKSLKCTKSRKITNTVDNFKDCWLDKPTKKQKSQPRQQKTITYSRRRKRGGILQQMENNQCKKQTEDKQQKNQNQGLLNVSTNYREEIKRSQDAGIMSEIEQCQLDQQITKRQKTENKNQSTLRNYNNINNMIQQSKMDDLEIAQNQNNTVQQPNRFQQQVQQNQNNLQTNKVQACQSQKGNQQQQLSKVKKSKYQRKSVSIIVWDVEK